LAVSNVCILIGQINMIIFPETECSHTSERANTYSATGKQGEYINITGTHSVPSVISTQQHLQSTIDSLLFGYDASNEQDTKHQQQQPAVFCKICRRSFSEVKLLETHLREKHSVYACVVCDKSFISISGYNTHKIEVHDDDTDSCGFRCICKTCGKSFSRKSRLILHERKHSNIKLYECQICHRSYKHKANLTSHLTLVHGPKM
jgi:hypothetical protein